MATIKKSSLQFFIRGIALSNQSERSSVVLSRGGAEADMVLFQGQEVAQNYSVYRILKDKVILQSGSEFEAIELVEQQERIFSVANRKYSNPVSEMPCILSCLKEISGMDAARLASKFGLEWRANALVVTNKSPLLKVEKIHEGDLILGVDGYQIHGFSEFKAKLQDSVAKSNTVFLRVNQAGNPALVAWNLLR